MSWQLDGDEPKAWRPKQLLSPPQAKTIATIRRITLETGVPPTLREIAKELGSNRSWAKQVVDRLVQLGHLVREPGLSRAICVSGGWIPSSNDPTKRTRGMELEGGRNQP